jgi:Flp pilus assembly protein TadG
VTASISNSRRLGTLARSVRAEIARLRRDRRGIAAIEFALVLPFLILVYLGGAEVAQAIAIQRLVGLSASTVANITTQYQIISKSSTMPDILGASTAVLYPYPSSNAVVRVSYITIDATGKATVAWSQAQGGSALTVGQQVTLPTALDIANSQIIFGETNYAFTPAYDYIKFGTFNLYSSVYMYPRSPTGTVSLAP